MEDFKFFEDDFDSDVDVNAVEHDYEILLSRMNFSGGSLILGTGKAHLEEQDRTASTSSRQLHHGKKSKSSRILTSLNPTSLGGGANLTSPKLQPCRLLNGSMFRKSKESAPALPRKEEKDLKTQVAQIQTRLDTEAAAALKFMKEERRIRKEQFSLQKSRDEFLKQREGEQEQRSVLITNATETLQNRQLAVKIAQLDKLSAIVNEAGSLMGIGAPSLPSVWGERVDSTEGGRGESSHDGIGKTSVDLNRALSLFQEASRNVKFLRRHSQSQRPSTAPPLIMQKSVKKKI
eukprot:g4859.t1